jgi:hypothetical protein
MVSDIPGSGRRLVAFGTRSGNRPIGAVKFIEIVSLYGRLAIDVIL